MVLCDDHEIVREAIKARMASVEDVEIVGEAETGEVVGKVKELEPDVCIVDVELPGKDGIDATKDILKVRPETRVIIFTAHAQPDLLTLALRAGASGYVLKSAPSEDIARAIDVVAGGGTFVGTELGQGAGEVEKLLELTPREREILELLAEGLRVRSPTGSRSVRRPSTPTSGTRSPGWRWTRAPRQSPWRSASATWAPAARSDHAGPTGPPALALVLVELEGAAVDAVAEAGCLRRSVVEDVPEVGVAA